MLTIKSNEHAESLIENGALNVDDDIEIAFDGFSIKADIICKNIYSKDERRDINCRNINCRDINCRNINCGNIECWDINCENIDCGNIEYYALVVAYFSFRCKSATGKRNNSFHKCLDSEIELNKMK